MGLRVLAAMSGGVDSATAAARAVDAGHEVTGVHLALSSNPQSYRTGARGCCTVEDARDARRAADVIGIPFYVWDMAERFSRDVVDDFVAEYARGRTPNPCLRCNEKIKFAAVLDRAVALGFDAVVTGHHARLGPDGLLRRSVDAAKDQSYVLAVLTRAQLSRSMFPLGDSTKAAVRAEAVSHWGDGVKGYADLDGALADPAVELVVIATPHDTHADLAVRTLEAGKHCVVDKVMALTTEALVLKRAPETSFEP